MPSVRQIRRRIRSVQNTAKITKAMSMIAASKMRRAQQMALRSRPYAERMRDLLADLAAQSQADEDLHPLLRRRAVSRVGLVHVTPDRGLTGGLNSNMNRRSAQFILEHGGQVSVIAVGRKGRDFMVRHGTDVRAVFVNLPDRPSLTDITPAARLVIDDYTGERLDAVYITYARFASTTVQRPVVEQLLPVVPAELRAQEAVGYIYEPGALEVLSALLPRFVEIQLYHAVLEAVASEQSARMVAMRNATDNANTMVEDLTLVMNKARQESVTNELLDIVGGAVALTS